MTSHDGVRRHGGMVRNIIHLGLGQIATTILTILLNALLARTLGPADFGLLFLVTSIATFVYVVVDWGYGSLIIRETARFPGRSGELLGSALAARTAVALVACAVAVGTTWLLGYDVRTRVLTGTLILAWLPQYLGLSFGWVFRGRERMDRDAALNVALKLSTLIGSVACIALGGRLLGLMVTWSLAGCLTLAIAVLMYRHLRLPAIRATLSSARSLLRDGTPLFAVSLAVAVEPYFNANILYKMTSPAVSGWYGAAWNIAGTLIAPATVLGATIYPRLSVAAANHAEFRRAFEISFRPLFLLAVLGAVGTYLFADVVVGVIYSLQRFGPAADTLRAFSLVMLLMYIDIFLATAIVAAGKAGRLASVKVASVVVTTGLAYLLTPIFQARFANGGLGVMYAMTAGELLMLIAATVLIRAAISARTINHMCRSLVVGVVTVLLLRVIPAFEAFLNILAFLLVFVAMSLLTGAIKRDDVRMLIASFRGPSPVPTLQDDVITASTPAMDRSVDLPPDRAP